MFFIFTFKFYHGKNPARNSASRYGVKIPRDGVVVVVLSERGELSAQMQHSTSHVATGSTAKRYLPFARSAKLSVLPL